MMKKITDEQIELIKIVCELPPVAPLFFMTATDDQKKHWLQQHNYWQIISTGLHSHFSGVGYEKHLQPIIGEEIPRFLKLSIEKWVKFYNILSFNWNYINTYLDKQNMCLSYLYNYESEIVEGTPGLVFSFILEQKSYQSFAECLENYSCFSPRRFYNDYKNWQKIKSNKSNSKPLSENEKESYESLKNKAKSRKSEFLEGVYLQHLLIDILKTSRDKDIIRQYKEYNKVAIESTWEYMRSIHPSKKKKGWAWVKGEKLEGNQGFYS